MALACGGSCAASFWAIVVRGAARAAAGDRRAVPRGRRAVRDFVRALPPLAYFSLLIIWFGIEDTSKIWLLFLAAFPPITLAVLHGVRSHPRAAARRARCRSARTALAGRRGTSSCRRCCPSCSPAIRLAIGFAWTTIVAAETVDGIPGIGGLAWATKKFQQTDVAVLCIVVIGLTAIVLDQLVRAIERPRRALAGQAIDHPHGDPEGPPCRTDRSSRWSRSCCSPRAVARRSPRCGGHDDDSSDEATRAEDAVRRGAATDHHRLPGHPQRRPGRQAREVAGEGASRTPRSSGSCSTPAARSTRRSRRRSVDFGLAGSQPGLARALAAAAVQGAVDPRRHRQGRGAGGQERHHLDRAT